MWFTILKTTNFTYNKDAPKGRAIGRSRGTDDIEIGLPRWGEIIDNRNLSDKQVSEGIANTIQHEYTHIATTQEFHSALKKLKKEMIMKDINVKGNIEPYIIKFVNIMFMDEWMARAGMPKQEELFLTGQKSLQGYPKAYANKFSRIMLIDVISDEDYNNIIFPAVKREFDNLVNKYKQKLGI